MGATKWMMSLGFIVIFSIAIISYVTNFGTDNSAVVTLDDDLTTLNANLKTQTTTALSDANSSIVAFSKSDIAESSETTVTGSAFKGNDVGLMDAVKFITDTGFSKIFGQNSQFGYVLTVFMFLMGIISFLVWWKVWKGGNPD